MYSETKKKVPNIASPTKSIAAFAPLNVRLRKSERSSIGARWCRSSSPNVTSATAAIANAPTMRGEVQP